MNINSTITYQSRQKTLWLDEPDIERLREQLLNYFQQTYKLYENLFHCLKGEAAYYQYPNRLRHPLIFYYGHTATFYINKLVSMRLLNHRINESFESLFAIGVDEMSWDDLDTTVHSWPSVADLQQYRDKVYATVSALIQKLDLKTPITQADPAWIILMGIEHEHIHLETSAVLIRELPLQYVQANPNWQPCREFAAAPANQLITVNSSKVTLHKQSKIYGWDNEYGKAEFDVEAFKASQYLVSNQEYLKFIEANGYSEKKYWNAEAWQWCQSLMLKQPHFWRKENHEWLLRVFTEEIPMPWSWPVEVNYYEAKAFCNYLAMTTGKKIRLPTEAEWHVLAKQCEEHYPDWQFPKANIDLAYFASSCPVNKFQHGQFYDVIGNVWQWTETPIYGFEGFQPHTAYDDFSIPTFDGRHHIFKGGSWISCGNEVLIESRYAFRKHFYQFAGIRYVEAAEISESKKMYYETDKGLAEYLELHYGADYFQEENFLQAVVNKTIQYLPDNVSRHKALDLGCAVGRSCFELARYFDTVYGVDFSARFIQAADALQRFETIEYSLITEGELTEQRKIALAELNLPPEKINQIHFLQGDACNLHRHLTGFDLIIASNLIDRLYDPKKFLLDIIERMNSNGVLAICSPYTWLEEYTHRENWLGGFTEQGNSISTFAGLKRILEPHFRLITDPIDIPFVIRETARKFQHSISQLTLWQKVKL